MNQMKFSIYRRNKRNFLTESTDRMSTKTTDEKIKQNIIVLSSYPSFRAQSQKRIVVLINRDPRDALDDSTRSLRDTRRVRDHNDNWPTFRNYF